MCVWCPLWPVQRLLSAEPEYKDRPVILFGEARRALHVTVCSRQAWQAGVRSGMPLGEARSLLPVISRHGSASSSSSSPSTSGTPVFKPADPVADREKLRLIALACQQYSPLVGLEETAEPESFWLEISGSEDLFGGQRGLMQMLCTDLARQGFQVRIAIAETWAAAWAMAHFAASRYSMITADEAARALAPLPVAALRIPDAVVESLRALDVTQIEQLRALPRASLPSRFGKELVQRLDQALGLTPELLTAERLVEPIRVEWLFEEAVTDRQTLDHVCEVLLERVLVLVDARRAGLRELTCHWLGTATPPIALRLLRPTTDHRHLIELLRLRCERAVFLSGVIGVRIEVVAVGLPPVRQGTLFDDHRQERRERSLEELVDRLSSRLGDQAVLRANLQPDPLPEFSCQQVPWLTDRPAAENGDTAKARLPSRPLTLLAQPRSLCVEQSPDEVVPRRVDHWPVVRLSGPERIESGWWRGPDLRRDYYRMDLANGARWWVFRDRGSGDWFLHGLFS